MYESDTLGIYNTTLYNEKVPSFNKDIEQGNEFMNYRKLYSENEKNKLPFVEDTSAPGIGSIVEAMRDRDDSTQSKSMKVMLRKLSKHEAHFNSLLSDYATSYNTFNASLINSHPSSDDLAQRDAMEQDLQKKYQRLIVLANAIQTDVDIISTMDGQNKDIVRDKYAQLLTKVDGLKIQQDKFNRTDAPTLKGKLETSELATNSIHIHFIVYLFVAITLIGFTFYIIVNPNANVLNAVYVVSLLIALYIISRWVI
jgi:hypothetical protein